MIDCRWITSDTGGIRRYTLSLAKHLPPLGSPHEFVYLYDDPRTADEVREAVGGCGGGTECDADCDPSAGPLAGMVRLPHGPFSPASQVLLPGLLRRHQVDVFHSPNFMLPVFSGRCRVVITVHDLIPYLFPEWCHGSKKTRFFPLYKMIQGFVMRRADGVITVSQHSRGDLARVFPHASEKIRVVYNGIDLERFKSTASVDPARVKGAYGLPAGAQVLLYAGRQDPSKNLTGLMEAFGRVARERDDVYLVIAGMKDERYPQPFRVIEQLGLSERVVETGVLGDAGLLDLYNSCDLLVSPSFYEGFGLVPLEAMACGLPVITSKAASLPEVVGDAAIMVDPDDTAGLAAEILRVLDDGALRTRLSAEGPDRARLFSWKRCATETLACYEEVCGCRTGGTLDEG